MATSRSGSGSATTELRQVELPAISLTGPGAVTPAPRAQARLSAAPATTGTGRASPNRRTRAGRSSPAMVQDGRVAALWGGGVGWPGFTAVTKSPSGARFIVPDAEGLRRIQAKHAFLKPLTVPAGSYPGQDAPIASLGSWSFIMARPGLPDDAAYRLAKALHRAEVLLHHDGSQMHDVVGANDLNGDALGARQDRRDR